jgi:hypothetical protein
MKAKFLIPIAAGLILLAACKGKSSKDYEFIQNNKASSSAADSTAADTSRRVAEKLVKTAEINLKVRNVQKTEEDIAVLTSQYKGMVMHHQVQSTAGQTRDVHMGNDSIMRLTSVNTNGEMAVRIPSENLEEFTAKVSHLGIYVNMNRMDIEDKSLEYLSNQLKLKDRLDLVEQQKTGKIKIKNPTDVLLLKDDMVDQKIQNLRTDAAVKMSIISLNFYQNDSIVKEIIPNDDPSAYDIPFVQRLRLALVNGWSVFIDTGVALLTIWPFIICALIIWRLVVHYRRRDAAHKAPVA